MREIRYNITTEEDRIVFRTIIKLLENYVIYGIEVVGEEIHYKVLPEDVVYIFGEGYYNAAETIGAAFDSESGAAWFRQMRREVISDSVRAQNKWEDLITQIAQDFYKRNPLLVYIDSQDYEKATPQQNNIKKIIRLFYPSALSAGDVIVKSCENAEKKKVFAASLHMLIRASAGAPTPVLGRLYFTVDNNQNMVFLDSEEATQLEKDLFPANAAEGTRAYETMGDNMADASTLAKSIALDNAFYNTVKDMLGEYEHLEKKIIFNATNAAVIKEMTKSLREEHQEGDVEVEVTEIKVNMYFVISKKVATFDVFFKGKPEAAMRATVLFGRVSLRCLSCTHNNDLMNDSNIHYKDNNGKWCDVKLMCDDSGVWFIKDGHEIRQRLDADAYKKLVAELRQYVFGKHLQSVRCEVCMGRRTCRRYVCEEQQIRVFMDTKKSQYHIRCADCLYPESFVQIGNDAFDVNSVYFDADKRRLVLNNGKIQCACCGRDIDENKGTEFCDLCSGLLYPHDDDKSGQRKLYRAYRGLLPLSARVFRFGSRCVEDQSRIVFHVGRNMFYSFDKIDGYINGFSMKKCRKFDTKI